MTQVDKAMPALIGKMIERDPLSAAVDLETLNEVEAARVLKELPIALASQVLKSVNESYAGLVLEHLPDDILGEIVRPWDTPRLAYVVMRLPAERRPMILDRLDPRRKRDIEEQLEFPEDSAGRIMSREFLAFKGELKVKDAVARIREVAEKSSSISYVYVVGSEGRLDGILNMRDLLLAKDDSLLNSVMRKQVFSINSFADRESVASELSARKLFAAPVVDSDNRLLGVVKSDKLLSDVQAEATEDLQKMFGAGGSERVSSSLIFSMKRRLPWLHVNLLTAFLAAGVVALFEDVIAKITVLAVFLPVVAGQGGNAGAQSLAVVMRGIVMREIPQSKVPGLIVKETMLGCFNGIITGVVTAFIAWWWNGNPFLGVVIGLGMIVNLTAAGLAGAAIPLGMKKLGLDPAQCSSIILTTVTDVVGFFAFLGFALLFQNRLI